MGRPPVYLVWVLPSAMLRTAACRSGSITGDASFARPPVPRAHVGHNQPVATVSFQVRRYQPAFRPKTLMEDS
jgi:hypothetical protein